MNTLDIAIPVEVPFTAPPHGVSIERSANNYIEFAEGGRNWPVYTLRVLGTVSLGVLSNYLYDTIGHSMQQQPKTILIEHEDVQFEHGEIHPVLRDKMAIQQ